jgi:hypothetical protein
LAKSGHRPPRPDCRSRPSASAVASAKPCPTWSTKKPGWSFAASRATLAVWEACSSRRWRMGSTG